MFTGDCFKNNPEKENPGLQNEDFKVNLLVYDRPSLYRLHTLWFVSNFERSTILTTQFSILHQARFPVVQSTMAKFIAWAENPRGDNRNTYVMPANQ